jgi:hypothetical protein
MAGRCSARIDKVNCYGWFLPRPVNQFNASTLIGSGLGGSNTYIRSQVFDGILMGY